MIYLIGGVPRSGKTIVTKKLAKQMGISWISVDSLEGVARHFTPASQYAKRFPKNVMREKTKNSNDVMYSTYTPEQIKKAYIAQATASWNVIKILIEWLIAEDRDYIIEGYQIAPKLAAELVKKYGPKKIKTIFLTRHDVEDIVLAAKKGRDADDWFIKKTEDVATYPKIAAMISKYGDHIKGEAKRYGFVSLNMDENFVKQTVRAIQYLRVKR